MRLAAAGADVLYIVTGKRGGESVGDLSEAESTLLARYRSGSPALRGYLQELGQAPASGSNAVTIGGDVGQQAARNKSDYAASAKRSSSAAATASAGFIDRLQPMQASATTRGTGFSPLR